MASCLPLVSCMCLFIARLICVESVVHSTQSWLILPKLGCAGCLACLCRLALGCSSCSKSLMLPRNCLTDASDQQHIYTNCMFCLALMAISPCRHVCHCDQNRGQGRRGTMRHHTQWQGMHEAKLLLQKRTASGASWCDCWCVSS